MERFVIVCAERTGSNLLLSMLRSHPSIGAAGELFNNRHIDDPLPWPPVRERKDLIELRRQDRRAVLVELEKIAQERGFLRFGFKLMYFQAQDSPTVVEQLVEQPGLRVIHLLRRNRLRRYLSHVVAKRTDTWKVAASEGDATRPPPSVTIDFADCVRDFLYHEQKEQLMDRTLGHHAMLHIHYEDLADDPQAVGGQVLEFLGMPPALLELGFKKTGVQSLREAIANYDDLKRRFDTWNSFFEE